MDLRKLRPLIGKDGRPLKDVQNNPIIIDLNNKPIKGTGINVLLDQSGLPVYNYKGEPILIDRDGQPINLDIQEEENDEEEEKNENIPKSEIHYIHKNIQNIPNNVEKIEVQQPFPKKDDYVQYIKINNNIPRNDKRKTRYDNNRKNRLKERNYYPGPNPEYQRNNNIRIKINKTSNDIHYYPGSCFACEVGCGVSSSGYSTMNYSPYDNRIKRREHTPLRGEEFTQYNKYKKKRVIE